MHDDKGDVPRGEPTSARAPYGTNDFLRVFGDPRNGFSGQELSLVNAFEFFQPSFVADVVADAVYKLFSSRHAPILTAVTEHTCVPSVHEQTNTVVYEVGE